MISEPEYLIARFRHGWALVAPPGVDGVPATALSETMKLFPRDALVSIGLSNYLRRRCNVTACIVAGTKGSLRLWETEARTDLATLDPLTAWWMGLDTGASSEAMFAALGGDHPCAVQARAKPRGETPKDADDFGRCLRVLLCDPTWESRLHEVANAYPDTTWPSLIQRWDELKQMSSDEQSAAIEAINHPEKS